MSTMALQKAKAKIHDGLCQHCKDVLEWKVKYNKYKALTQPRKWWAGWHKIELHNLFLPFLSVLAQSLGDGAEKQREAPNSVMSVCSSES